MKRRFTALALACGLLATAGVASVSAQTPPAAASAELGADKAAKSDAARDRVGAVYAAIAKAAAEAKTQDELVLAMTVAVDDLLDYDAFAARTLKTTWPTLDAAQQGRFKAQFKRLIIKTYARRFKPQSRFAVSYRGDTRYRGETKATVQTTVKTSKVAADVDYKFNKGATVGDEQRWFVYDIVIDDVSMALNWRAPFEKIIARDGFEVLITKIESKVSR